MAVVCCHDFVAGDCESEGCFGGIFFKTENIITGFLIFWIAGLQKMLELLASFAIE